MIDQDTAVDIARQRAQQNEWPFAEPLHIVERKDWQGQVKRYEIETHAGLRGSKSHFTVDAETGKILKEGTISR